MPKKNPPIPATTEPVSMQHFEKSLKELEGLVERMEKGDRSLEESLKDFERGVALTRSCQEALKAAEQKVQQLIEHNGKPLLAPFDEPITRD